MRNFAAGPVEEFGETLMVGEERTLYFLTPEFSLVMLENERLVLEFAGVPAEARAVFLTGSGTAGMEATVLNVLREDDQVLVVNGGSFGTLFCQICEVHGISHDEVKLEVRYQVRSADLKPFDGKGHTASLVKKHVTSTGELYDMDLLGEFCRRNGMLSDVDNISSFLADEFAVRFEVPSQNRRHFYQLNWEDFRNELRAFLRAMPRKISEAVFRVSPEEFALIPDMTGRAEMP